MKKVKFIMSAVTMLALVGGALAFKGKAFTNHKIFCNDSFTHCTIEVDGLKQSSLGLAVTPCTGFTAPTTYELVANANAACTLTTKVIAVADRP